MVLSVWRLAPDWADWGVAAVYQAREVGFTQNKRTHAQTPHQPTPIRWKGICKYLKKTLITFIINILGVLFLVKMWLIARRMTEYHSKLAAGCPKKNSGISMPNWDLRGRATCHSSLWWTYPIKMFTKWKKNCFHKLGRVSFLKFGWATAKNKKSEVLMFSKKFSKKAP